MVAVLPAVTAKPTESKRSGVLKKALTGALGVACAAGVAIGLYGSHSEHFQHDSARILQEISQASGIHVKLAPKAGSANAPSGLTVDGYLFPKTDASGKLAFDGRLTYLHLGSQYNFTVVDDRGYVTVEEEASGKIVRNECLLRENIPPLSSLPDALLSARVIDDVSSFDVPCAAGKLVEFVFADEPYIFCSTAGASLNAIHGEDIQASIQVLKDSTDGFPSRASLTRAEGKSSTECELLTAPTAAAAAAGTVSPAAARKLLATTVQRAHDVASVVTGSVRRSLADATDCGCRDGLKTCLIVHGLGYDDGELTDSFAYFGEIEKQAKCCSSVKFIHLDTTNTAWYDDAVTTKLCKTAQAVSKSADIMNLENLAIVAHSMGNMITSSALTKKQCGLAASSKWIALAGPIFGSASAASSVSLFTSLPASVQKSLCTDNPNTKLDNPIVELMYHYGLCPTMVSLRSIATKGSKVLPAGVDALYAQSGETYAKHVSANMCGVNFVGLLSKDSATLAALGVVSGHASLQNDGQVDWSSCHATIDESRYSTSWDGGKFYKASINHLDASFRHGDGMWGKDRKPIKWFNCQF